MCLSTVALFAAAMAPFAAGASVATNSTVRRFAVDMFNLTDTTCNTTTMHVFSWSGNETVRIGGKNISEPVSEHFYRFTDYYEASYEPKCSPMQSGLSFETPCVNISGQVVPNNSTHSQYCQYMPSDHSRQFVLEKDAAGAEYLVIRGYLNNKNCTGNATTFRFPLNATCTKTAINKVTVREITPAPITPAINVTLMSFFRGGCNGTADQNVTIPIGKCVALRTLGIKTSLDVERPNATITTGDLYMMYLIDAEAGVVARRYTDANCTVLALPGMPGRGNQAPEVELSRTTLGSYVNRNVCYTYNTTLAKDGQLWSSRHTYTLPSAQAPSAATTTTSVASVLVAVAVAVFASVF